MGEYLWVLVDSSGFMPRRLGGSWSTELVWLHNASDVLIWLAYMAISAVLAYWLRRWRDMPYAWMFLMFGLFIISCGFTHFMEVVTSLTPVYRLSGLVKLITAVVSWATVIGLVPLVPKVLALRSSQELEKEIASRQRAEEALARQTSNLRAQAELLDLAHDAVLVCDTDGTITFWNRAAESLYGWTRQEALGQVLRMLLQTEFPRPLDEIKSELLRAGRWEGVLLHTRSDGTRVMVASDWTLKKDDQGSPAIILQINRDITARMQAEQKLRESEARFRALAESAHDAIIVADPAGKIAFWNKGARTIFGYEEEEALGQPLALLMPEAYRDAHQRGLERFRSTGESRLIGTTMELQGRRKDGSHFPLDLSLTAWQTENGRFYCGMIRDVSRRKRAEDTLKAHARQQVAVAALGQRGLAGADLDMLMDEAVMLVGQSLGVEYTRVMEVLPGGQELLLRAGQGWKEGTVGPETVPAGADSEAGYTLMRIEPVISEDLRGETRYRVPQFVQDHRLVSSIAVVIPGAESPFGVLVASTIDRRTFSKDDVQFLQGIANVLGIAIGRKQAEEALRRAHDELELRVRERTANLAAANLALQTENAERQRAEERLQAFTARLERSNHELQDFASVASHDLQEPLRKIQGFAGRLRGKYAVALGEQGRDYLERMESAVERMRTLIQDLLAFSRITSKAQPFAPVDLAQVAREVISDLEGRIQQTQGQVQVGELPTLEADATQMRQLLQNLISNALKFHRPETAPLVKVHSDWTSQKECRITVQDNGIGFDEKYRERIFQVFERLHGRGEYDGTGMGLAICRKIAERHGGSIMAASAPGHGASFMVTLPIRHSRGGKPNECTWEPDPDSDRRG